MFALIFTGSPYQAFIDDKVIVIGEMIANVSNQVFDVDGPFRWVECIDEITHDNFKYYCLNLKGEFVKSWDEVRKYGIPIPVAPTTCQDC